MSDWSAITAEVRRLAVLVERHQLGAELRWRVRALERAATAQRYELLALALGPTGRTPPPAAELWSYDGVSEVAEIAEAAVWHLAIGACEVCERGGLDALRGARAVLDAWEAWT